MTSARPPEAKASAKDVFINHERKLEDRRRSDTALVLTLNDANHQSARSTLLYGLGGQLLSTGNQSLWVPGGVWLQS